eukprot:894245-Rhodomonas_salina.6
MLRGGSCERGGMAMERGKEEDGGQGEEPRDGSCGSRVQGLGSRVQGLGSRVSDLSQVGHSASSQRSDHRLQPLSPHPRLAPAIILDQHNGGELA